MNEPSTAQETAEETAAARAGWRRALADAGALALPYWRERSERQAWTLLAAVLVLTLGTVALNVRFSTWNSAFYDALQNRDLAAFGQQMAVFGVLAVAFIVAAVYRQYLQQRLVMHWRVWLTQHLLAQWLRPGTAYRLGAGGHRSGAPAPDNPDQRLAEDVQQFVAGTLSLALGLLNASVTLLSFVAILWRLSGTWPLGWGRWQVQLPGAMVWVALVYAGLGSWLAQRIGRPLVPLGVQQQRAEADFRYALVQVRDQAEAIALARGEAAEGDRLHQRLQAVRQNWWRVISATKRLTWFSAGYGQVAVVFPMLAAAPRYFAGHMALGGLMQTAQAFGQVQGSLSWFIDAYGTLADWRATVQRLAGFRQALQADTSAPALANDGPPAHDGLAFELEGLMVQTPEGRVLMEVPYAALAHGGRVLLAGPSGQGKSALLRTLAGLWPARAGRIRSAPGRRWLFVPQRPYLPATALRAVLAWPSAADAFDDDRLRRVLRQVGLAGLAEALSIEADWGRRLSPGEQQRLQFARVLLQRPDIVVLDEASAALDLPAQAELHALLAAECPGASVLSVAHRPELAAWHGQVWRLEGATLVSACRLATEAAADASVARAAPFTQPPVQQPA